MTGDSSSQEAPQWPAIEGDHHSARFIPNDNDHDGVTFAQAVIQPPFTADMDSNQVRTCMYHEAIAEDVTAQHVVSTAAATLIEIRVESAGSDEAVHARRTAVAYEGVKQLVDLLDMVEFDVYDPRKF